MDKREEILDSHKSIKFDGKYGITGRMFYHESVIEAMSEYAQLESIEFAEWMMDKGFYNRVTNAKGSVWFSAGQGHLPMSKRDMYTTSELYQIFKQEQQTTK